MDQSRKATKRIGKREARRLVALSEAMRAPWAAPVRPEAIEDGPGPALDWYVLTVTALAEKAVANRLKRRVPDCVVWWPVATRRVKRAGLYETSEWLPMPRYLFVGFASPPPWLWVFETQGVHGVLGVDGRPVAIDAGVVGTLMWRCATGQVPAPASPSIQKGLQVVARRGVIAGFEGVVTKVHKQTDLVEVMFELIGGLMPITLPLDHVAAVV